MKYKQTDVIFKERQCTCGACLQEEGKDVTRKINEFTDSNGVHFIGKTKKAICFDCNYCDTTLYQIFKINEES